MSAPVTGEKRARGVRFADGGAAERAGGGGGAASRSGGTNGDGSSAMPPPPLPSAKRRTPAGRAARDALTPEQRRFFDEDAADEVADFRYGTVEVAGGGDDDSGNELEFPPDDEDDGGAAQRRRTRDEEDDEDGNEGEGGRKAKRVVRKLVAVEGESKVAMEEEFNEAGDAFEPFNLRSERTDGYFDEGGNYVWKKRSAEDFDPWLQSVDELDPRRRAVLQSTAADTAGFVNSGLPGDVGDEEGDTSSEEGDDGRADEAGEPLTPAVKMANLRALLRHVHDDETVTSALRRLRPAPQARPKGGVQHAEAKTVSPEAARAFDELTEAADVLLLSGMSSVYTMPRKELQWELEDAAEEAGEEVPSEARPSGSAQLTGTAGGGTGSAGLAAAGMPGVLAGERKWLYRWQPSGDAEVFGPFAAAEMLAWHAAGCFSIERPVYVHDATQPSTTSVPAPPPMGGVEESKSAGEDDDNDDIFANAGTYTAKPAATGQAAEWPHFAQVLDTWKAEAAAASAAAVSLQNPPPV